MNFHENQPEIFMSLKVSKAELIEAFQLIYCKFFSTKS